MNILIIGKYYPEGFARHIAETLEDMGHSTIKYDIGQKGYTGNHIVLKRMSQAKNALTSNLNSLKNFQAFENNKIKKTLSGQKVDLTIVTHDFLFPSQVSYLKELTKTPFVLWHPDAISNLGKYYFLNAKYDFLFFKDPYVVKSFKKDLNLNVFYLPECCNPKKHYKVALSKDDEKKFSCDITTAGNLYPNREAFFRNLTQYKVKIWGSAPPNWLNTNAIKQMIMGELVLNENKSKAFQLAKIVLNNLHPAEIWGVNARTFEIPACGGFEMINYRPGLNQLFEINKEVVAFNDYNELIELIDYYLHHDKERLAIANAGRERAQRDHTYNNRLEILIDTIFGNKKGFGMPEIKFS